MDAKRGARRLVRPLHVDESRIAYQALRGSPGVMIDAGAHHGSSLVPFARDGWTIHAFEPDPANRTQLEKTFGETPNVRIIPKGLSDEPGELPLYTSGESTGISSLAPFTERHRTTATVDITTLAGYVAEEDITSIDFLKIDVEGFERHVLRGHDWGVKPRMIVLEFEDRKTVPLGYSWTDLADELTAHGYQVLVSEWYPIERYGGSHSWRRFERYPTPLRHPDAWGNLIAAPDLSAVERASRRAATRHRVLGRFKKIVRL